ncbi:MAG: hypothetical protein QOI80_3527 [Solirubrobacteraceae bacterium]|jgi:uncharacterized membrane protein YczE|nr:hypothetical protein [Solirubrobacteraceae bacterium]
MIVRRLIQLYVGLVIYGISCAMIIRSALGNDPWDVLHQGLARQTGLGTGVWTVIVSGVVLLLWIPLRQRPGFGTVSNAIVVGLVMQVVLDAFARADALGVRMALMLGGVVLNGIATGMYIGARLGPGPRDGLMTGLVARGGSIRVVRTGIEVAVLFCGWLLGGTVGIGTVIYALGIGPLVHITLPLFMTPEPAPSGARPPRVPAARPASRTAP